MAHIFVTLPAKNTYMHITSGITLLAAMLFLNFAAFAQNDNDDYNKCTAYSSDKIDLLLKSSAQHLRQGYGRHAQEASTQFLKKVAQMASGKQLLVQAPSETFVTDTTRMPLQWQRVFKQASTSADSIEALSHWIAAHMINAEHRPDLFTATAETMYGECTNGTATGDAANFAAFLAKVSLAYPQWGVPVVLSAVVEVEDTANGPVQRHSFVGYARANGQVWCVADPMNGGVVRHAAELSVLSLDTIQVWLKDAKKAGQINLPAAPVSLQSSPACVFSFLLRNNTGLVHLTRPGSDEGFAKGVFYTPAEPGHYTHALMAAVWKKKKMAAAVFFNYYGIAQQALFFTDQPELMQLLEKRYNLKAELAQ
jgi:hypothetical protein